MARLPWVPRETLERADAELARLDGEVRRLQAAYDALLSRYHALKMAGAVEAGPTVPVPPVAPDPVIQAAIAQSRGSGRLAAHYVSLIASERARNTNDADIVKAIMEGIPDNPETTGIGD